MEKAGSNHVLRGGNVVVTSNGTYIELKMDDVLVSLWPTLLYPSPENVCRTLDYSKAVPYLDSAQRYKADGTLQPWADGPAKEITCFNRNDFAAGIDRKSWMGVYPVETGTNLPINPINPARSTGIRGPGVLGRFGPNHAVDPLLVRKAPGEFLEFLAVKRPAHDGDCWAIAGGGMVNPRESLEMAEKRELGEEAFDLDEADQDKHEQLQRIFELPGKVLFRGYSDDHRNTDNAWVETVLTMRVVPPELAQTLKLKPRTSEVDAVAWLKFKPNDPNNPEMFASHYAFLKLAWLHVFYG